jgi:hypothetical protein
MDITHSIDFRCHRCSSGNNRDPLVMHSRAEHEVCDHPEKQLNSFKQSSFSLWKNIHHSELPSFGQLSIGQRKFIDLGKGFEQLNRAAMFLGDRRERSIAYCFRQEQKDRLHIRHLKYCHKHGYKDLSIYRQIVT